MGGSTISKRRRRYGADSEHHNRGCNQLEHRSLLSPEFMCSVARSPPPNNFLSTVSSKRSGMPNAARRHLPVRGADGTGAYRALRLPRDWRRVTVSD
jgi:hypothetical protein